MTKGRDFASTALRVVEKAIGEHMDGSPLETPESSKNPSAVALGRRGGLVGGKARAQSLSATRRKLIARKAAKARWNS